MRLALANASISSIFAAAAAFSFGFVLGFVLQEQCSCTSPGRAEPLRGDALSTAKSPSDMPTATRLPLWPRRLPARDSARASRPHAPLLRVLYSHGTIFIAAG